MVRFNVKLSLIGVFLTSSLLTQNSSAETEKNYWEETGLTSESYTQLINTTNCYKEKDLFYACISAINSLIATAAPKSSEALIISGEEKLGITIEAAYKKFGGLIYAKISEDSEKVKQLSAAKRKDEYKRRKNERLSIAANLFNKTKSRPINFEIINSFIQTRVLAKAKSIKEAYGQAINAYINIAIDPHTYILPTAQQQATFKQPDKNYVGIGISYQLVDSTMLILEVNEIGPAFKAEIYPNDRIIEIDGVSISKINLEVENPILGEPGTFVELTIKRNNEVIKFLVERQKIITKNVSSKLVTNNNVTAAYIRLNHFMDQNACSLIREEISRQTKAGANAIILDLRGNGGGLVTQGVCIGGIFAGRKIIVQEKNFEDNRLKPYPYIGFQATNLPMVTLIDSNSASASEIVAGALQDYERSWILGDRSYGKGTMQGCPEQEGGISYCQTMARFYRPSGITNQIVGITPDFQVAPFPDANEDDLVAYREEDLYQNALPAIGDVWKQKREKEVLEISDCMATNGKAESHFKELTKEPPYRADYRVLKALDLLACQVK